MIFRAAVLALAAAPIALIALGALPPVFGLVSVGVGVATLLSRLRGHIVPILLVFTTALLLSILATKPAPKLSRAQDEQASSRALENWSREQTFDRTLPIVVHIILDEMMSTGAMTPDLPGADTVREALYAMGERHGLRTFDAVYSRSFFSGISIPNLMNVDYRGEAARGTRIEETQERTTENAYFADMARRGYRTAVFQSAVLGFCANEHVTLCQTFDSFDSSFGSPDRLDPKTRAVNFWTALLRALGPSYLSQYGQRLVQERYGLDVQELQVLGSGNRFDAHGFPDWFDRFADFAAKAPRGTHVFAHLMVPHSPYVLTPGCLVSGVFDAGYYLSTRFAPGDELAAARRRYYADYLRQVECVVNKVDALLKQLSALDQFRDSAVIIHGDHGSRISSGNMLEDHSRQDFVDNYATYFAVKLPGVVPGVDCTFAALPDAFRHFLGRALGREVPLASANAPVVLPSKAGATLRVEAAMPAFGCAVQ